MPLSTEQEFFLESSCLLFKEAEQSQQEAMYRLVLSKYLEVEAIAKQLYAERIFSESTQVFYIDPHSL